MTGARYTSVAPVWLRRPQVHVLLDSYARVFPHELAHVFSREFGLPVLRASLAVGLVEGLAVALEPPDGLPSPHEQVAAASMRHTVRTGEEAGLGGRLVTRLSPLGFWTGRGAVSYTTTGSFVRYLLETYGAASLRRVYATADFEAAYGRSLEALTAEWEGFLQGMPVMDRSAGGLSGRRFAVPSIFEKRCPHYVPRYRRLYADGASALEAGDTLRAGALLAASLAREPAYEPSLSAWAGLQLAAGAAATVVARLDTVPAERMGGSLAVRLADAHTLLGRSEAAHRYYTLALGRLPAYAHEQRALLLLRRTLAQHPGVMHALLRGGPAEGRADALEVVRDAAPAAAVFEALYRGAAGNHASAAVLLEAAPAVDGALGPAHQATLRRQRAVWAARLLYRGGALGRAGAVAGSVARDYRADGAFNVADQLDDVARKMAWLEARANGF
jgi:hypothetical protein